MPARPPALSEHRAALLAWVTRTTAQYRAIIVAFAGLVVAARLLDVPMPTALYGVCAALLAVTWTLPLAGRIADPLRAVRTYSAIFVFDVLLAVAAMHFAGATAWTGVGIVLLIVVLATAALPLWHSRLVLGVAAAAFAGVLLAEAQGVIPARWYFAGQAPHALDPRVALLGALVAVLTLFALASLVHGMLGLLRRSEARYRLLYDTVPDSIGVYDRDGRLTIVNDVAARQLGYAREQLLGRSFAELIHPDDVAATAHHFTAVLGGATRELEVRALAADGSVRWLAMTGAPLREDGGITSVLAIGRDVTERRELEERLRQSQKLEAVGRLAGGVAHDFNNLLMAIGTNVELALAELPPESTAREELDEVRRATRRAAQLTRQLLAFGSRQVLRPRVLAVNDVVAGAERLLRRAAGSAATFTVVPAPEAGWVLADQGQLEQVLLNLVVNARDALGDAAGSITVETGQLRVGARHATCPEAPGPGAWVTLTVRDSGEGMDDATRARVFEPFFTTKPQGRGTGLGLATVYGIVRQSGGHVTVESAPGAGTTFTIHLPAAQPDGAPAPTVTPAYGTPAPTMGAGGAPHAGTILLVEDEASVRASLRRILERHHYHVLEAKHGRDALLQWEAQPELVDLVLTDVLMPVLDGPGLVRALRERRPDVRVLYMSGYTGDAVVTRGVAGDALLEKPFAARELLERVREAMGGVVGV